MFCCFACFLFVRAAVAGTVAVVVAVAVGGVVVVVVAFAVIVAAGFCFCALRLCSVCLLQWVLLLRFGFPCLSSSWLIALLSLAGFCCCWLLCTNQQQQSHRNDSDDDHDVNTVALYQNTRDKNNINDDHHET